MLTLNRFLIPIKNLFYANGICKRWILKKETVTIGRIAAFINFEKNKNPALIVGGIGFFECINNEAAAFKLFDTAKSWLKMLALHEATGAVREKVHRTYRKVF